MQRRLRARVREPNSDQHALAVRSSDTPERAREINLMRDIRVLCHHCDAGYMIPWHEWSMPGERGLFYRCVACGAEMIYEDHRQRKHAIIAAIKEGRSDVSYAVSNYNARTKR